MIMRIMIICLMVSVCSGLFGLDLSFDTNNDGVTDRWITVELMKDWAKFDFNKNGKPDESFFYEESDKVFFISTEKLDSTKNGKPNIFMTNTVKGPDVMTKIESDVDGSGKINLVVFKKNDKKYLQKMDTDHYGVFDVEDAFDENGRMIRESVDSKKVKNGTYDDNYYYENDLLVKEVLDSNFDGKPDVWVTFKYNPDNSFKECVIERDGNYDGKVDEWHYTDNQRRVIRVEKDTNGDGKPDKIIRYDN